MSSEGRHDTDIAIEQLSTSPDVAPKVQQFEHQNPGPHEDDNKDKGNAEHGNKAQAEMINSMQDKSPLDKPVNETDAYEESAKTKYLSKGNLCHEENDPVSNELHKQQDQVDQHRVQDLQEERKDPAKVVSVIDDKDRLGGSMKTREDKEQESAVVGAHNNENRNLGVASLHDHHENAAGAQDNKDHRVSFAGAPDNKDQQLDVVSALDDKDHIGVVGTHDKIHVDHHVDVGAHDNKDHHVDVVGVHVNKDRRGDVAGVHENKDHHVDVVGQHDNKDHHMDDSSAHENKDHHVAGGGLHDNKDHVVVGGVYDNKDHHVGVDGVHDNKDHHVDVVGQHDNKDHHVAGGGLHDNKDHLVDVAGVHDDGGGVVVLGGNDHHGTTDGAHGGKDHSAGRQTEDGNGSEFGSNSGSSYSDRRHKHVYVYAPPTKRTTGGHSSGGGGGVSNNGVGGGGNVGHGKIRGSVAVNGSVARANTVSSAKSKNQQQQQQSQGSPQKVTGSLTVACADSPQRRQPTSHPGASGAEAAAGATKHPTLGQSAARPITAASEKKVDGNSASKDAKHHDNEGNTLKQREDAARSDLVSEDDSNIYKSNLLQIKQELNHMKERAAEVQSAAARRQAKRISSSKKVDKNSFHALDDFDCSRSYCDTQVLDFFIRKDTTHRYYPVAKVTATTLLDPWDELAQQRPAERVKRTRPYQQQSKSPGRPQSHRQETKDVEPQQPPQASGGGEDVAGGGGVSSPRRRPPILPVVDFSATAEYWRRPLFFDELPAIRSRIREAYSTSGRRRRDLDYARTAEECRSLELESLDRVPGRRNRTSLARCCSAYLGSRPGSRAALGECLERVRRWWEPGATAGDGPISAVQVPPPSSGRRSRQQAAAGKSIEAS